MRGKERHSVYMTPTEREALNQKIRDKFEKEAHDRERVDIDIVVDIHKRWTSNNAIMQLMIK